MKTLYFGGPTWIFMTPEQMYGEEAKLKSAHKHYQNADIYFLTKMQKVRFVPSKTSITSDGKVRVVLTIGDPTGEHKTKTFAFPAIDVLYTMKHISNQFANRESFFFHALYHYYIPKRISARLAYGLAKSLILSKVQPTLGFFLMKLAYGRDVKVLHKTPYEITIEDPIAQQLVNMEKVEELKTTQPEKYKKMRTLLDTEWDTDKLKSVNYDKLPDDRTPGTLRLTVDQIINNFKVDVGIQEIIYIGKTEREPFERLLPHEHLQELESQFLRNDGEAIVVHLFGFKKIDVINNKITPTSIPRELGITTIEAELINYFKPKKNVPFVKDEGKPTWDHIKKLRSNGYAQIITELNIEGQYTKFATKTISDKAQGGHFFVTDLSLPTRNKNKPKY